MRERGRPAGPGIRRQALVTESGRWLDNPVGVSPGVHCVVSGAQVYAFPGVPRELRAMFEAHQVGFERRVDGLEDLLDAGRDLARAEGEFAEALVDYHQALAALEGLVGFSMVPE